MNLVAILIFVLATARVTHFFTDDFLVEPLRERLQAWMIGKKGFIAHLGYALTCTWCSSVWFSSGATALAWVQGWLTDSVLLNVAFMPALSYSVVVLEALVEKLYGED